MSCVTFSFTWRDQVLTILREEGQQKNDEEKFIDEREREFSGRIKEKRNIESRRQKMRAASRFRATAAVIPGTAAMREE